MITFLVSNLTLHCLFHNKSHPWYCKQAAVGAVVEHEQQLIYMDVLFMKTL